MPISTTPDARNYILSPEFLKNNPDLEHERGLLITGKLDVARLAHPFDTPAGAKAVVQMRAPGGALEPGGDDAREAKVWYRAMPRSEYLYLKRFGKVQQEASYGVIAADPAYGLAEMDRNGRCTHLLEFDLRCYGKSLYQQLRDAAQSLRQTVQEPIVDGSMDTFGLGAEGHYSGQAGKLFNELLLQGSWRLLLVELTVK